METISVKAPPAPAETWPQTRQSHPFDADTTDDRHEREHRQSSEDATVTGMDGWARFRAANYRQAAGSWTGQAAWLRANGGSAQEIAAADFHAARFAASALLYGRWGA